MNRSFSFEVSLSSIPRFEGPNRFCTARDLPFKSSFAQLSQRLSAGTKGISDEASTHTEVGLSTLQFDEPLASTFCWPWKQQVPTAQIQQVLGVSRMVIWRMQSAVREKGLDYAL